ncbi:MAG: helix-turn-helix domain-containing protein [Oscillospiraceae bacterium]|nr:helix-turn-helix domain-containing protein [Oscillospiraceae bacterium]
MAFTQEELAAMAAADREIEETFTGVTEAEAARSDDLDIYLALSLTGVQKAKNRVKHRRYYARCREEILARERADRAANPEKYAVIQRRYYESHRAQRCRNAAIQRKKIKSELPCREFGIRLRAARKAAGMSAAALGKIVGLSESAVYNHEEGFRRRPNARLTEWLEQEEQKHGKKEEHGNG